MPLRSWPLWPALALLLLLTAVALPTALAQADGRFVYSLDDAYIHMAMAKNLAAHGVWGCTPFHFSSSSSSLLWTLSVAVVYAVTGVRDLTPFVLNAIFAVLLLGVTNRYLARFAVPALTRAVTLAGMVVAVQLPAMVLMGMEHVLHLVLSVACAGAAIDALIQEAPDGRARRRQATRLCVLAALVGASRFEGFFLVGAICVACVARRRALLGVQIGAAALAPVALFGAIAVANGSLFFPNSLMLKAGGESLSTLAVLFKPFRDEDIELFVRNRALLVFVVLGAAAVGVQWARLRTAWRPEVLAPLLLLSMIVLHAHFAFSSLFWVYRYDAYLVGFGLFAVAVAMGDEAPRGATPGLTRGSAWRAVAMATLVAATANIPRAVHPVETFEQIRNNYIEHYQAARFVRRFYPGDVVVVNDIGAMTYFTNARVLDMFGLGDIEPVKIRRAHGGEYTALDVQEWTQPYRPSIAILQLGWGWVRPRVPRGWIKVAEFELPDGSQTLGFFAVNPDAVPALRRRIEEFYLPLSTSTGSRLRLL